ncbi:MAG TPA: hypothetical protein VHV55_22335 [Pirellulales bacterium]|jgi:hypothetical protein|nr:hypothetical protein [Pirellulales bacterium]
MARERQLPSALPTSGAVQTSKELSPLTAVTSDQVAADGRTETPTAVLSVSGNANARIEQLTQRLSELAENFSETSRTAAPIVENLNRRIAEFAAVSQQGPSYILGSCLQQKTYASGYGGQTVQAVAMIPEGVGVLRWDDVEDYRQLAMDEPPYDDVRRRFVPFAQATDDEKALVSGDLEPLVDMLSRVFGLALDGDSNQPPAKMPRARADSADTQSTARSAKARIPANELVKQLARRINANRDPSLTQVAIALDVTKGNRKKADTLLRGLRRHPDLLKSKQSSLSARTD